MFQVSKLYIYISASGLFVASKYPILKAKVDVVPTTNDLLKSNTSSLMLLKIDLGFKKKDTSDHMINNGQLRKENDVKERCVGFLSNVSSSQNINNSAVNNDAKLKNKLEPVIEDFKRTNFSHDDEVGELDEGFADETDEISEKILFSVIAGRMPTNQGQSGKQKIRSNLDIM